MQLRDLTAADLDAITELDQLLFAPGIAFPRESFAEALDSPACESFGYERDGRIVAFAVLYFPAPRAAQIITIDVHPDHRRQGLGGSLLAELEARALRRNVRRMVLQVAPHNTVARNLYLKRGYILRSTLPDYYGPGLSALLMDKVL